MNTLLKLATIASGLAAAWWVWNKAEQMMKTAASDLQPRAGGSPDQQTEGQDLWAKMAEADKG